MDTLESDHQIIQQSDTATLSVSNFVKKTKASLFIEEQITLNNIFEAVHK